MSHIEITNLGQTLLGIRGETLLDTLQRLGYKIRISCRNGVCQICEVQLQQGEIKQRYPEAHIKLSKQQSPQIIYACTSTPITDIKVKIEGLVAPENCL